MIIKFRTYEKSELENRTTKLFTKDFNCNNYKTTLQRTKYVEYRKLKFD